MIKRLFRERNKKLHLAMPAVSALVLSCSAGNLYADNILEVVEVTAQKRSESLQDVTVSISALSGDGLDQLGISDLDDITSMIPGVTFTAIAPGIGNLVMRGISVGSVRVSQNSLKETVGVYINDAPVAHPTFNPDISPFDLERVEVLRGPQGTLYGSGSLSGTVRYITKKADASEFAAKLGGEISSTKDGGINYRVDGMVNIPVSDTFALRLVGYETFDDGYIDGVGPVNNGAHQDDSDKTGARLSVFWDVTDQFTVDASVLYEDFASDLRPLDNEGFAFSRGVSVGEYEQYRDWDAYLNHDTTLYNLTLNYDIGWGALTSSSSLLDRETENLGDFTPVFLGLLGIDHPIGSETLNDTMDFSQEIRIATSSDGPVNFVGGIFYSDVDREQEQITTSPGFDATADQSFFWQVIAGAPFPFDNRQFGSAVDTPFAQFATVDEQQVAVFGELTWDITEKWSAVLGLRWFDVEQEYSLATAGFISNGTAPVDASGGEDGINPKFLLAYQASDDVLISAQAARGFRLGGLNERIPVSLCGGDLMALGLSEAPESFDSEYLWNYELNAKTTWLENRLTVNGAIYYLDYEEVQITTQLDCGFVYVDNAATARSMGVELEVTFAPIDDLLLTASATYNDAELQEDVPQLGGEKGDQLPLSSEYAFSFTGRYEFVLGEYDAFAQYVYTYTDSVPYFLGWQGNSDSVGQPGPSYSIHNVRFGLGTEDWDVSLFIDNIFDKRYITFEDSFFGGLQRERSRGRPMTAGLSFTLSF